MTPLPAEPLVNAGENRSSPSHFADCHSSMRIAVMAHALHVAGGLSVGQNLIAAFGRVAPGNEYLITIPAAVRKNPLQAVPSLTAACS
jgi:hypothetical protein